MRCKAGYKGTSCVLERDEKERGGWAWVLNKPRAGTVFRDEKDALSAFLASKAGRSENFQPVKS